MAAGTAANVTTGKHGIDGGIYLAPVGTTLPTDATTALAAAFKNLGYVSEDGVTIQPKKTVEAIKEWNGDTVDENVKEYALAIKVKLLESVNPEVLKLCYGTDNVNVDSNGNISVRDNANDLDEHVCVIDTVVKGNRNQRRVFPRVKLSELGDIVLHGSTPTAYDSTISAFVGSDGDKQKIYISAAPASST